MAVLSRRKRAIAQGWDATNREREEQAKQNDKTRGQEKITEEEHKKRVEMLKRMGVLK